MHLSHGECSLFRQTTDRKVRSAAISLSSYVRLSCSLFYCGSAPFYPYHMKDEPECFGCIVSSLLYKKVFLKKNSFMIWFEWFLKRSILMYLSRKIWFIYPMSSVMVYGLKDISDHRDIYSPPSKGLKSFDSKTIKTAKLVHSLMMPQVR